ncbi:MAG: phosphoribosylformylglycinamidine cyclo-ligase [Acidimicrobiia bacterium]|jgi:phosphoribosylformylglycinamidine cyclo-ligase
MAGYRDAGVDLDAADAAVRRIGPAVTATWHGDVVGGFGGFAAGIRIPGGYRSPVLMMSTDGVGTKAELARRTDRLDGLGWDLVAMCVDDLAAAGARPIAMTDYLAVGHLDVDRVGRLVASIAAACGEAGVALLGGETAEHPGVMEPDAFDLAGAALGVVEEGAEVDGAAVVPGDVVVGIDSPNLRSNGFSLLRATVLRRLAVDDEYPGTGRPVGEVLLEPSVLYTPVVQDLLAAGEVHGLVHVTGGGLPGNLPRVLPEGTAVTVDTSSWNPAPVFAALGDLTGAPRPELFRTFNMGIGFVVIVPASAVDAAAETVARHGREASVIGEVTAGDGGVTLA